MAISDTTLAFISKILNVLCATVLIIIAILRFALDSESLSVLDAVWTFYWIVFAVFILLAEFKVGFFLRYLNFMSAYFGKGVFITFCGTLLIDSWKWQTVIGIILIINGCLCILLGFKLKGDANNSDIKEPIQDASISKA